MARNRRKDDSSSDNRPAFNAEQRENQLIGLAMDLAEKKLRDGTASNQTICYFLELGSSKGRLKKDILKKQKSLMEAKTEAIKSARHVEELYANALKAMQSYSGQTTEEIDEEIF